MRPRFQFEILFPASRYFDGYISYRGGPGDDFDFVHNQLLEKLQGESMNYKICIDTQHFIGGDRK